MPTALPAADRAALPTRTTALAARLLLDLAIVGAVCAAVAVFFSVVLNNPFWRTLVFSLGIGLSCMLLIDGGLRLAAQGLRLRHPDDTALRAGWPGWRWALPIILAGSWGGVQIGYSLAGWLLGISVSRPGLAQPRTLFINLAVSVVAAGFMVYWSWSRERLAASEARAQAALRAAAETRLKLLEAQLEPHMLFNTLANLRVLITLDPPRAQAMLDHLIAFLRATLDASRAGLHPLATEFDRLADYLALMAVRMGPRLAIEFDLPVELRDLPVPPLLLQPLVENSIRHGLEPKVEGGRIDVRAAREGAHLVLTVRDSGVGPGSQASAAGTGFGIEQVRQRLAALYGGNASLVLEVRPGGGTEARVSLPLAITP